MFGEIMYQPQRHAMTDLDLHQRLIFFQQRPAVDRCGEIQLCGTPEDILVKSNP